MTAAAAPGRPGGGDEASLADEGGPPRKRGRFVEGAEDDAGGSSAHAPLEFALEPDEYAIALDMTGKAGLGLDVDWADGKTLLIKALKKEGAISDWNRRRPPTEAVEAGDRIVSINGKIYDTEAMLAECRSKHRLHVVIRTPREPPPKGDAWAGRPLEYDVELDLDKKPGLGLDVDWADGKTLFIKAVKPEGAIPDWNKRRGEKEAVRAGDRIVSINGKAGDPKAMLAEVKKKGRVQLTIKADGQPQESPAPPPREKPAGERGGGGVQAAAEAPPRPPPGPTKAHEFVVWADMARYTALGLDVSWEDGRTLFVNEVKGGAVQEWNSGHLPHQQVATGDRVIAVNGYSGDGERMAELCRELADAQGRVLLHVRGPPPPPPPESKRPAGKGAPTAEEKEPKKEKREKKEKKAKEDREEKGTKNNDDDEKKDKDDKKEEKKEKKERREKKDT